MDIETIKIEFIALIKQKNNGYIISMEMIYNWLEHPKIYSDYSANEDFRRDYRRRYLRSNDWFVESKDQNDLNKDFIMVNCENNISYPWFSVNGFKALCMTLNTEKSRFVRQYFIQIESDYVRVLEQTKEQNDIERIELNAKIAEFEKQEKTFHKKVEKITKTLEKVQKERDETLVKNFEIKNKISEQRSKSNNIDDMNNVLDELEYSRKHLMKQVPIYIVNPEFMTKAKKEKVVKPKEKHPLLDSSDESGNESAPKTSAFNDEHIEEEKSFNEYRFDDIEDEYLSQDMYYFIGSFSSGVEKPVINYHKVGFISVGSNEHLKFIKDKLDSDEMILDKYIYKTSKASIYICSYQVIMSFRLDYILEKCKE